MNLRTRVKAISRTMVFQAPKYVQIVDLRLACLKYSLYFLIMLYVLFYDLFYNKGYLEMEVPIGRVNNWANIGPQYLVAQQASLTSSQSSIVPCAGNLDDYEWSIADDVRCAYLGFDELITNFPTGGVFVTTHLSEIVSFRKAAGDGEAANGEECAASHTFQDGEEVDIDKSSNGSAGTCTYKKAVNWLAIGAEYTIFEMKHEFDTSREFNKVPKTIVRSDKDGPDKFTFRAGERIRMTLAEILDVAHIDLDARYADQLGEHSDETYELDDDSPMARSPMARLAGLLIKMDIRYYNYNMDKPNMRRDRQDVIAIITIRPSLAFTELGPQVHYRSQPNNLNDPINMRDGLSQGYMTTMRPSGVFIDVTTGGKIGYFNYTYVMNALVNGVVLLGVAVTFTTYVAMYLLGTKSKIYSRNMCTVVDFQREAAQFALQAILASDQYRSINTTVEQGDLDGIDLDELHKKLVAVFCSDRDNKDAAKNELLLDEEDCRMLAIYIMRAGDAGARKRFLAGLPPFTKEELHLQRIDQAEWNELMTRDVMDVQMIKECIKWEAKKHAN